MTEESLGLGGSWSWPSWSVVPGRAGRGVVGRGLLGLP